MDRYRSFEELSRQEVEGRDFVILVKSGPSSLLVMAPHGGGIEPGTVDLAHAVAGADHGFYAFKGTKPSGNAALHITSNRFDEPRALRLARRAEWVLTIHGCKEPTPKIFVGGRDVHRRARIIEALNAAGFTAEESLRPGLRGANPNNICNRGHRGRGVQLELSDSLRRQMYDDLRRRGRRKTHVFHRFTGALRQCLAAMTIRPTPEMNLAWHPMVEWRVARDANDRLKAFMVRAIVFMEEQSIPFELEVDAFEDEAVHVLGEVAGEPVAAGRLRFADGWAKLERIAVRRAYRGKDIARQMIEFMLQQSEKCGYRRFRLHAQTHLRELYQRHGFQASGDVFQEAGIDHVLMTCEKPSSHGRSLKRPSMPS